MVARRMANQAEVSPAKYVVRDLYIKFRYRKLSQVLVIAIDARDFHCIVPAAVFARPTFPILKRQRRVLYLP